MYYFAYGLNLNRQQMLKNCPQSKPKFPATLHHYQFVFTDWTRLWRGATATIKPQRGGKVLGGIYEVNDNCLRQIERQLGSDFRQMSVIVNNEDGEPVEALTYLRHNPGDAARPSPEYLTLIQQGYKDWRLI